MIPEKLPILRAPSGGFLAVPVGTMSLFQRRCDIFAEPYRGTFEPKATNARLRVHSSSLKYLRTINVRHRPGLADVRTLV